MTVKDVLGRAVRAFPSYDIAPRTRTRHEALTAARASRDTMLRNPANVTRYFPYASRSPHRSYRLSSGLDVSLEDRWLFCGAIGCGKTTAARQLISGLARLYPMTARYTLDSKADRLFDRDPHLIESDDPPPLLGPGESLVWRPPTDDLEAYSAWFESILKGRAPAIVFIDELSSIGKGHGQSFAPGFAKLLKQGRSLHQCVITLSQEAAYQPRQVTGQLHHLARMRLLDEYDAKKLDRLAHGTHEPRREPLRPHGIWYKRLDRATPAREFSDWRALLE
jgi:ATPase family associated with various cellular activities (AAA)